MNFNDTLASTFGPLSFIRPYWLIGLIIIAVYSLWRYQRSQHKQTGIIANHLSEHLVTLPETSKNNRLVITILSAIACIALSGPSLRSVELPVYEIQKAQVIALDLSYSMYATDIKPNRLSRAKYKAIELLKQWSEGEKGLIAYAGDAFTITPLTIDSNAIINHIPHLSPELMPVKGSRPDLALQKAISLLENAGYQQGQIVFISDGFDQQSLNKMKDLITGTKWMVSVLAMATPAGAAITLPNGSLLKDDAGNIVIPKLEANKLYPIANMSDGLYLTFDAKGQEIPLLANHYDTNNTVKENQKNAKNMASKQLIDDGYWLSLLLLPLFLLLFRKGTFYVALLALTLPLTTPKVEASIWKNSEQNAYQALQDGDYTQASDNFHNPDWKAAALFKDKQYKQAEAIYSEQTTANPKNATTLYNLGNAQAMQKKYQQALESYQQGLALQPDFAQAKANKEAVEKLLEQQEQEKKQQQDQQGQSQQDKQQSSEQQDQQSQSQQDEQQSSEQQNQQDQQGQSQQDEQQSSEQQNQQDQQGQSQQDEQQSSEQQNQQDQQGQSQQDEQQSSKQQNQQDQQGQSQQDEQQSSEQQNQQDQQDEQQEQLAQQQAEMNAAAQSPQDQAAEQEANALSSTNEEDVNKEYEELPIWLKNMPDDPSLLLRNKMQLEYRKRAANKPVLQKNNGEIW
ncbi:VWA domain-containing protein [Psychromonas sp. SA13A]|uniref:vWA domain-containing protein n=1 Tax=Psychromonas sp. SA13A TaxID=2686346 RepID=UPI00140AD50F|nr:VWA domain-containing protein [Psychromonas sp. SA13A]